MKEIKIEILGSVYTVYYKRKTKTNQNAVLELVVKYNLPYNGEVKIMRNGVANTYLYSHCGKSLIMC